MLNTIKQKFAGLLAKILIALLVVSFSLWGIGDVFVRDSDPAIVEIGGEDILVSQYRRAFTGAFNRLSRRAREQGQTITIEQARQAGLDRQVLRALISQNLLEQDASSLDLTASEDFLIELVNKNPNFQGAFGQFDPLLFQAALQNSELSQADYLKALGNEQIRLQFISIFNITLPVPDIMVEQIYHAQNEKRIAQYAILTPNMVAKPPQPTQDELNQLIENHFTQFTLPEKRQFALIILDAKPFTDRIRISDAELKNEYRARINQFKTPEKRKIQQMIFPDYQSALKARKKMKSGRDFIAIAKKRNLSKEDIALGWLSSGQYLDEKIEKAALGLKKNAISAPIEADLGFALLYLDDIQASRQKSFNSVKKNLRQKLALDRALEEIDEIHDLIEDERAAGVGLAEIAKKFKLRFFKGQVSANQEISLKGLPKITNLKQRIFNAEVIGELPIARTDNGHDYWLELVGIIPPQRLDDARAQKKARQIWAREQVQKSLRAKAEEIARKISLGGSLRSLTKAKIRQTPPLARFAQSEELSPEMLESLFRIPQGGAFQAVYSNPNQSPSAKAPPKVMPKVMVVRLAKITSSKDEPKARANLKNKIKKEINELIGNEKLAQYLSVSEGDIGFDIDLDNLNLAFEQAPIAR